MLKSFSRLKTLCSCCAEPFAATAVSRRDVLLGGAASLAVAGTPSRIFAQAKPQTIDVHHHIVPPSWLAQMDIIGRSDFPLKNWSVQKTIEDMDKGGVAVSMTSPTTPQVTPLAKDVAVKVARESNDYAKKMMTDHPTRFGV